MLNLTVVLVHHSSYSQTFVSMGKPGRDLRRSRVDIRRSRVDIRRSRVDICRSKVKHKILIFLTIRHCQKLKIL